MFFPLKEKNGHISHHFLFLPFWNGDAMIEGITVTVPQIWTLCTCSDGRVENLGNSLLMMSLTSDSVLRSLCLIYYYMMSKPLWFLKCIIYSGVFIDSFVQSHTANKWVSCVPNPGLRICNAYILLLNNVEDPMGKKYNLIFNMAPHH